MPLRALRLGLGLTAHDLGLFDRGERHHALAGIATDGFRGDWKLPIKVEKDIMPLRALRLLSPSE